MLACNYCGRTAELVDGSAIYPRRPALAHKRFYRCLPCDAYVGCHDGTENPLGRLANAELRREKMRVHAAFDPLWKDYGRRVRRRAYRWLAALMLRLA